MSKLLMGTFLVLLGCVFLLANFSYISWDVVEELAKLWPLLLVAWGIVLVTRGSKLAFLGFLGPLVLVLAVFYAIWSQYYRSVDDAQSFKVVQELTDIDEARVVVKFAGGKLNVRPADSLNLIEGELSFRADSASPRLEYYEDEGVGYVSLHRRGRTRSGLGVGNRWEVSLSDQIPLEMRLVSEGATCNLDLEGLQIVDLDLSAAASRVDVRLGRGDMNGEIRVDAGASIVRIEIPRQYGIRLYSNCGLCWRDLPDGMSRKPGGGGAYYSEGYEGSPYKMDVEVDAGISKVTIEQY